MTRHIDQQILTHDIDLGAAFMAATGKQPRVFRQYGEQLVSIELPNDEPTRSIMLSYAAGELVLNVKRFASCRSWLFRQIKEVKP